MIIASHYGQTGAHTASPEPGAGQSIMGLTREECSLPCMCSWGCPKGTGVAEQISICRSFHVGFYGTLIVAVLHCREWDRCW